jgi:hypothetical protein
MLDRTARAAAERWGDAPAYVAVEGWTVSYGDLVGQPVEVGVAHRPALDGDVGGRPSPPLGGGP